MKCRICGKIDCDDDCEELATIYREALCKKLADIELSEIYCEICGKNYEEESHSSCMMHYDEDEK